MANAPQDWLNSDEHKAFLVADTHRQFDFFDACMHPGDGFHVLDREGAPMDSSVQELHATTRMVHSYALGHIAGRAGCDSVIEQGMRYLTTHHLDPDHGGYLWALDANGIRDSRKLAYGHAFVLLAAASAKAAGHPDADALLQNIEQVLDTHFWEEDAGLFRDEWNRDWTPFSTYRGMNGNMHGAEAMLAAYEVTGREKFLVRAQRILDFLLGEIAPAENWRVPEHYTNGWEPDRTYSGDPMFRPAGTMPGHSFELAKLFLQYSEIAGTLGETQLTTARQLVYTALSDAWDTEKGGIIYTLKFGGAPHITDRYWWPVTEAIGAMAALLKADPQQKDADWYKRLWRFAEAHFVDTRNGGWFPEIDASGRPTDKQFAGKPDIYHSVQATMFPMTRRLSGLYQDLSGVLAD